MNTMERWERGGGVGGWGGTKRTLQEQLFLNVIIKIKNTKSVFFI
jgi:hypothetical protein